MIWWLQRMNKSKAKGTAFETAVLHYFIDNLKDHDYIHREVLHGPYDIGDISGVHTTGKPGLNIAIECKNYGSRDCMPRWLKEASTECNNAGSDIGVVISKRRGIGLQRMGEQLVSMTLDQFIKLINGKV